MPGTKRRGIMGTILTKVVSALHKRANKSLHRRENHHVRPYPRRPLRDRPRASPGRPPPNRDRDRGRERRHVSFESDSSISSQWFSSDSPNESPPTEPKRHVDDRYHDAEHGTYLKRGRGRERQEPESESTRRRDVNRALPRSRVPLVPAGVQAETDWPLNQPLPLIPVPQIQVEPQLEHHWPLTAEMIPPGAISSIPILSEPDQQSDNDCENKKGRWTDVPDDEDSYHNTKLAGESGSNTDSDSESNISFDEWEDPEEYQRRLAAKKTKKDKHRGQVMHRAKSDAEAGPSKLLVTRALDQAHEDNRPMSGASTAPSWLEEVMTPYFTMSDGSGEHVNKDANVSLETPTREQIREGKRAEKPVHLGQIIVEEYHAPPAARSHSIRRKPVGSAPSRKITAASTGTISSRSGSVGPFAHEESLQAITENNQIAHIPSQATKTPMNRPNFSYPLKRDNNKGQSQPQPHGEKERRPRLNSPAPPQASNSPADDRRRMEQPRYNYMWDR